MNTTSLRRFWWINAPPRVGRISPFLSVLLRDGTYLTAWPSVAAYAPAIALVIGVLLGWLRTGSWTTYSFSIGVMTIFVVLSSVSAALGVWALCGWILGDFFLFSHPLGDASGLGLLWAIVRVRVPLLISYALLLALITIPFAATRLVRRRHVATATKPATTQTAKVIAEQNSLRPMLRAATSAVLIYGWTLVVPILIRPVMWWPLPQRTSHRRIGQIAPVEAFAPLQHRGWILAVVGFAAMGLRVLLERAARARPLPPALSLYGAQPPYMVRETASSSHSQSANAPSWVRLLGAVALGTLFLSGLASNAWEALLLAGLLLVDALVGRALANVASWTRLLSRISFPLRLVLIALASVALSWTVLATRWENMQTFLPVIIAVGLSLLVSRAFLADRSRARS